MKNPRTTGKVIRQEDNKDLEKLSNRIERESTKCRKSTHKCVRINLLISLGAVLVLFPVSQAACRYQKSESCEAICSDDDCTIRSLVLLPKDDFYEASLSKVSPILRLAEDEVHARGLLPRQVKFSWILKDDKCDASYALIKAMDGISKNCSHVIFGPVCDYALASVGRITKYFHTEGTPLISTGGFTFDFEEKKTSCQNEFYMLIRTGVISFQSIAELNREILKRYNWNKAVLLHERNGQRNIAGLNTCNLMMQTLAKVMRESSMDVAAVYLPDAAMANYTEELKKEVGNHHSIVIMCADPRSIRQIMIAAEELNMIDSGEYVFINIELFSDVPYSASQPWLDAGDTMENNEKAKKAYTAILTVTPKQPEDNEYTRISNKIKKIAAEKYNYTFSGNEPLSTFVTSFYDGVLLYAMALNDSIKEDPNVLRKPINGSDIVRRMWSRSFNGITGNVTIDANGDRVTAYSLLDLNPDTGRFEIVANLLSSNFEFVEGKSIHWAGGRTEAPLDMPVCGYDGALCPDNSLPGYAILSIIMGFTMVIMAIGSIIGYRHYKAEAEINSMTWKISPDEVTIPHSVQKTFRGSNTALAKRGSQVSLLSEDICSLAGDRQFFIPVGIFKESEVAIKYIRVHPIALNRSLMLELKRMKDIQHNHLVKFFGACWDVERRFLLTEYCSRGSLQDILENDKIVIDDMFKFSLVHDIVRGMHFLHTSDIKSHGNLKSSNCVVDSRFAVKITDFGLHAFRKHCPEDDEENCNSHAYWKHFLWTAPELLKMHNRPPEGTQKGDVYSFGIIVHEITTRQGPFYLGSNGCDKSPRDIIHLVKSYPKNVSQPFRPKIDQSTSDDIKNLMMKCWSEDPNERPDFQAIKSTIRRINRHNETGNFVDNLLKRMEQYANNLEDLVEERTRDYLEEKRKCEEVLYQLLPKSVAAQLIRGESVFPETFDQVTIYFSDVVGFTALSAQSEPMQVVDFLNDLYTCFDSIVENYDVYKVETIGDAYMVASGLPQRNGDLHSKEIARLALALLNAVYTFRIRHRPQDQLLLRIGLHTGPCVAGVVGLKMPRYCLFGDTVNTASRMESNGEALKIHISESTKKCLDKFGTFIMKERGYVKMKGKGEQLTYWLEGERPLESLAPPPYSQPLTDPLQSSGLSPTLSLSKLNGNLKTDRDRDLSSVVQVCDDDGGNPLGEMRVRRFDGNEYNEQTVTFNLPNSLSKAVPAKFKTGNSLDDLTCDHNHHSQPTGLHHNNALASTPPSSSVNFNNIVKKSNLKNNFKHLYSSSGSNSSEDVSKGVTQPLLANS